MFLNILNLSSVNIALPDISADLEFSDAALPWVISAYALTFAGFLLVGGRLADLLGRRRVLAIGFAIFGIFTLADALATSPQALIAARGAQGIGAALTIPAALGILTTTFEEGAQRSRAIAAFAAAGAGGFACGLILGGVVTDALGWRWVFGLTVAPIALLWASTFFLLAADTTADRGEGGVDVPGAVTATIGLLGLLFGLTNAPEAGWGAASTVTAFVAAFGMLAVFLWIQGRVREPWWLDHQQDRPWPIRPRGRPITGRRTSPRGGRSARRSPGLP